MSTKPNRNLIIIVTILTLSIGYLFFLILTQPLKPAQENYFKSMGIDVKDEYCQPDDPLFGNFGGGMSSGGTFSQPIFDKYWSLRSLGVNVMGLRESSDGKVYVGFREVTYYEVSVLMLMVPEIPSSSLVIRRTQLYVAV